MTEERKTVSVETALDEVRAGRMIIIVDDEDRENEGDLMVAAEKISPEAINFMARHGRGLICLPLTRERLEELQLPLMVSDNTARFQTAFTISIDAKEGVTTGISAHDRAKTILAAIDPETKPEDLARPGHIFPLQAKAGGVLSRAGQTEAAVDLAVVHVAPPSHESWTHILGEPLVASTLAWSCTSIPLTVTPPGSAKP